MVSVKAEVVQIKKAEPIFFGDGRVAANGVVLVCHPHDEDDVKSSCRVLEKFRHDRLHSHESQDDSKKGCRREGDGGVEFQHLQKFHNENKNLVLGIDVYL